MTPTSLIRDSVIGRSRSFSFLCIALTYGFVLSQVPDLHFKDFENYLVYADSSLVIALRYMDDGFFPIITNEPLWLLTNAGLGLFLDADTVVRTIIFFGASSIAWLILRNNPQHFFWLLLFLFLPQVIKNNLIHLRQGAAIAVFFWGWFAVKRSSRLLLMGLSPFIHASFFFILTLLVLTWILRIIRFPPELKTLTYLAAGLAFGLGLGFIAELLGARQAGDYAFEGVDLSGFGFMLWVMIFGIMLSAGKIWLCEHSFESGIVAFYLITYWLIEVAARIFESGFLVVLLAGLTLRGWRLQAFLSIVLGAGAFVWIQRMDLPALGFA